MAKDILRIPYKVFNNGMFVECFFNNAFRGYCLLDLESTTTVLNMHYFSYLFSVNKEGEIFLSHLYCNGLKMRNCFFKLKALDSYEQGSMFIYGVLGLDFIEGYTLLDIDKKNNMFIFKTR